MEVHASSEAFFSNKDTFLHMTIFLSVTAIFRIRNVCRSFNLWLSDLQNNFAWKKKIQLMFPNSYEEVLKNSFDYQMKKILEFDSFIDEGHNVSYFIDPLASEHDRDSLCMRKQIPWLRDTILIIYSNTIYLYNAATASILSRSATLFTEGQILLDIAERRIGFLVDLTLNLYRIENNTLVLERTQTFPDDYSSILSQIYGYCVIVREDFSEEVSYTFHSISKNESVKKLTFPATECFEELSLLRPIMYVCYQDSEYDSYHIAEIDCLTQSERHLFSNKLKVDVNEPGQGIHAFQLIESCKGRYLNIYEIGIRNCYDEVLDLSNNKIIYSAEQIGPELNGHFYQYRDLLHNPSVSYFCSTNECDLRIEQIDKINNKNKLYYTHSESRGFMPSISYSCKWINDDILAFHYKRVEYGYETFKKPYICQIFFSIARRRIIGRIEADVGEVFIDGENVFFFNSNNDLYVIQLDMTYIKDNKKRKISEIESAVEDDIQQPRKKAKTNK